MPRRPVASSRRGSYAVGVPGNQIFRDCSEYLALGERGTIKVIACDRKQALKIARQGFSEPRRG